MKERLLRRKGIIRVLSLVLTFVMCMSLFPITANAEKKIEVTGMLWDETTCTAHWDAFPAATGYYLSLYKDGVRINNEYGSGKPGYIENVTEYDLSSMISEYGDGTYKYTIAVIIENEEGVAVCNDFSPDMVVGTPTKFMVTIVNGITSDRATYYEVGSTVSIRADEPEEGKVFKGWTSLPSTFVFANWTMSSTSFTMPNYAVTLTATYKDAPKKVTGVSWKEGTNIAQWDSHPDANNYSVRLYKDGKIINDSSLHALPGEVGNVTEYDMTSLMESKGEGNYTFEVVPKVYKSALNVYVYDTELISDKSNKKAFGITPTYSVSFEVSGKGTKPSTQIIEENKKVAKPENPTSASGYEFIGWYMDNGTFENEYNFDTLVTADIVLYAKWQCTHPNIVEKNKKSPTCTTDGQENDSVCIQCGTIIKHGEVIPASHNIVTIEANEPTCTSAGNTEGKYCTRCREVFVVSEPIEIDPNAHSWGPWRSNGDVHECVCAHNPEHIKKVAHDISKYESLGNGYHTVVCSVCGVINSESENEMCSGGVATCTKRAICEKCGVEYGTFGAHNLKAVAEIPATCKATGTKAYYVCDRDGCGAKFEDAEGEIKITDETTLVIPKDPTKHGTNTEIKNAKEATCTEAGYTGDTYCKGCGEKIAEGEVIVAKGHTWDAGKVTKEPTKDTTGEKTYTCTKCGETKVEVIDKLPDDIKPSPSPSPDPDPVKPPVPEISVKGKFDVAAAVKTVSDKKPVAYAITTGNKKAGKITKSGIFTASKAGELEITAYADKKKTDEITKVKLVIKDTKVPAKDTISFMDDTCDLMSKITDLPLGVDVKFSISEKQQKIATVDAKTGIVTPVKDGKAKVTVEIGEGKNAAKFYTTITVKTPKFSSSKPVVIKAGNSKPLALKNVKSDDKIVWSVSDGTKAEIVPGTKDSKIKVKGIAAGKVTLTADVNGHKIAKEIEITE